MGNRQLVTQAEFAKQKGVHKSTVTRWRTKGVLVLRRGKVDVEATEKRLKDAELGNYRVVDEPQNGNGKKPGRDPANGEDPQEDHAAWTFTEARRQKEIELALKHRLERQRREGELVDKAEVEREQHEIAHRVCTAFLAWPGRVAAEIAADLEIDAGELGAVLEGYVRRFLTEQADDLLGRS